MAGDTTDSATPSTPLGPSASVPSFPQAQMSKLALGHGRDKQKGIFPPHGLRKTCASKMDVRKPWGLGTPTGRNKTQLIKHRLGKLLLRPVLLARTCPASLPPQSTPSPAVPLLQSHVEAALERRVVSRSSSVSHVSIAVARAGTDQGYLRHTAPSVWVPADRLMTGASQNLHGERWAVMLRFSPRR